MSVKKKQVKCINCAKKSELLLLYFFSYYYYYYLIIVLLFKMLVFVNHLHYDHILVT